MQELTDLINFLEELLNNKELSADNYLKIACLLKNYVSARINVNN